MALIVRPDMVVSPLTGEGPGGHLTLDQMQAAVGGYIELVRCHAPEGGYLVVNEEGLLEQLPHNPLASILARQPIVGSVIVATDAEIDDPPEERLRNNAWHPYHTKGRSYGPHRDYGKS